MSEKVSSCPTLYFYSLKRFVNQMDLTVKSLDKMCHLRLLPPAILSDIYREVSSAPVSFLANTIGFDTKKLSFFFL